MPVERREERRAEESIEQTESEEESPSRLKQVGTELNSASHEAKIWRTVDSVQKEIVGGKAAHRPQRQSSRRFNRRMRKTARPVVGKGCGV